MPHRIAAAAPPRPGVVGREHAAEERDQRDAVRAVVAERVDIPPDIAAVRRGYREVRSCSRLAAASRPDSTAIGTPGPGCTLPPARYSPGSALRDPGRRNAAIEPCTACPYSAPPVAGNSRSKSAGVVDRRCFRLAMHRQAAALQQAERPGRALLDLRCGEGAPVAGGGRVDQDQQPFGRAVGLGAGLAAILGADIDGGFGGSRPWRNTSSNSAG